ncbi:MAG: hypothetical protein J7498_11910 [Sphingobium sp.]|nr:hypothetical protein [Sphingobium sp.]
MRLIMWIMTIAFALSGLALQADGASWFAPYGYLAVYFFRGCVFIAILACPFLWARSYGFVPSALRVSGKSRLMMALAAVAAIPLILPWHH